MITGFPPRPQPREIARVMLKPFDLDSVRGLLKEFRQSPAAEQANRTRNGLSCDAVQR
jgi:hypothetical protein